MHTSVDEHLGCYHTLDIVNSVTMNVEMLMSLQDPDFSSFGLIPRRTLLEHMVVLSETCFEDTLYCFS